MLWNMFESSYEIEDNAPAHPKHRKAQNVDQPPMRAPEKTHFPTVEGAPVIVELVSDHHLVYGVEAERNHENS